MNTGLRVVFQRSGGLAGVTVATEAEIGELPDACGEVLRSLAGDQDSPPTAVPGAPDRFTYRLDVDDGHRQRVLQWPEDAVPEAVRPLIAELTRRSRPVT